MQARRPSRLALPLLLVVGLGFALLHYTGNLDAVSHGCRLSPLHPCLTCGQHGRPAWLAGLQTTCSCSAKRAALTLKSDGAPGVTL